MAYPYSHLGGGVDKTIALAIAVVGVLIALTASGSASASGGIAPVAPSRPGRIVRSATPWLGLAEPLPDSAPAFCGKYVLQPTSR
jgi:hypothetical protein